MYIVTAGKAFNDIDAFGCVIAYAELLQKEGKEAQAVFIGPLNHSVTPLALEQSRDYLTSCTPGDHDRFVYIDLSDPAHFAFPNQDESRVFEIYDHHYGFEDYWKKRLGDRSCIERVGAAATLIWEEFKKRGFDRSITSSSANVLALAILQNTLNFTSSETNERDTKAFAELLPMLTMPAGWQQRYFAECAENLHRSFDQVLRNDTKIFQDFFKGKTLVFSQLEITENPQAFLERQSAAINGYWSEFKEARGLLNIADMDSKTSVLYSDDPAWLHAALAPLFPDTIESSAQWIRIPIHQRKQIIKKLQA